MAVDPDVASLVGDGPSKPGKKPSTRQVTEDALARVTAERRKDAILARPERLQIQDFVNGVPVSTLALIFRMDPVTVKKRLADCPPKESRKGGYLYDIAQASAYLVKPVFDVHKYLSTMKATELPPQLQAGYWDAMLKKQKWEENAGDLWRTVHVQDSLAEVFKLIKQTVQLWVETVAESTSVTDEQRAVLLTLADDLQTDIYKGLVENVGRRRTLPVASELVEEDDALSLV